MIERELTIHHPADEAVADAMTSAYSALYFKFLTQRHIHPATPDAKDVIMHATYGKCDDGSLYSIYFLAKKYPNLFDKLALISSDGANYLVNEGGKSFRHRLWEYHTYFLAQDRSGIWYAGSPADYNEKEKNSIDPFVSDSLESVMAQIELQDGGVWTPAEYIEEVLNNAYVKPSSRVTQENDEILSHMVISREYIYNINVIRERRIPSSVIARLGIVNDATS